MGEALMTGRNYGDSDGGSSVVANECTITANGYYTCTKTGNYQITCIGGGFGGGNWGGGGGGSNGVDGVNGGGCSGNSNGGNGICIIQYYL